MLYRVSEEGEAAVAVSTRVQNDISSSFRISTALMEEKEESKVC
jgi:hypothetical protein